MSSGRCCRRGADRPKAAPILRGLNDTPLNLLQPRAKCVKLTVSRLWPVNGGDVVSRTGHRESYG